MTVSDLVRDEGFRTGALMGAFALVGTLFVVLALRAVRVDGGGIPADTRPTRDPLPFAGYAIALAGTVAISDTYAGSVDSDLVTGLLLLAIGPLIVTLLARRRRYAAVLAAISAVPGAAFVAEAASNQNDRAWVAALIVLGTVLGGALVADTDRHRSRAGLGPVLFAVTVAGAYGTLPDTELIAVFLGAVLPLALLGFPVAWARLGTGSYVATGLLAWLAAVEGTGRSSSVVGAFACLGILVLEPVVRRGLGGRTRVLASPRSVLTLTVIALQCAIVFAASRVAGRATSPDGAGWIALATWVVGAAVLAGLLYRPPEPRADGPGTSESATGVAPGAAPAEEGAGADQARTS